MSCLKQGLGTSPSADLKTALKNSCISYDSKRARASVTQLDLEELCLGANGQLTSSNAGNAPRSPGVIPSVSISQVSPKEPLGLAGDALCMSPELVVRDMDRLSAVPSDYKHELVVDTSGVRTRESSFSTRDDKCTSSNTLYFAGDDLRSSYRGILFPRLTDDFSDSHLEDAYQRYSHRQRQKSLVIVNVIDIFLKLAFIGALIIQNWPNVEERGRDSPLHVFAINFPWIMANLVTIGFITCWRQCANNRLHLAAALTWIIFNLEGNE